MNRRPLRPFLAKLLLLTVSLAAGFGIAELAMIRADVLPDYYWDWHDAIVVLDPDVLFRFRGHSHEELNALGYRDYEFDHDKGDKKRILMVGDSFQFGANVASHETLAKELERELGSNYEVFNMGIPGYGPDQAYGQLLKQGLDLEPDAVILSIFPGNDFNDIAKNQLYVPDGAGGLVYNPTNPVASALPWSRTATLLRRAITGHGVDPAVRDHLNDILGGDRYDALVDLDSATTRHKVSLMRSVLRLFKETLDGRGIEFYVFLIPSEENIQNRARFKRWGVPKEAYFNNEDLAQEICEQEGLSFVSLKIPFLRHRPEVLYTAGDGHLTVRGVELAIVHVVDLLEGRRVPGVGGSGALKRRSRRPPAGS